MKGSGSYLLRSVCALCLFSIPLAGGAAHAQQATGHGESAADGTPAPQKTEAAEADVITVYGRSISTSTLDIPQTVNVFPESLIEETGSDSVGSVLRFVPGASRVGSDLDAFGDLYLVRGFAVEQTVNGIATAGLNHARDTTNVERIEVLKGPASVLYGQMQPGAVINIVTKQPLGHFAASGSLEAGRYDFYRGTIDLNAPLTSDGVLKGRINAAYENSDSFVDFWNKEHIFVSPVVSFSPTDATKITLEGIYSRSFWTAFYNGLPAEGTIFENPNGEIPRERHISDPSFDGTLRRMADVTARVEHDFGNDVNYRLALTWTKGRERYEEIFGLFGWDEVPGASLADNRRSLTRVILNTSVHETDYGAYNDLNFNFDLLGTEHLFAVGADYENRVFRSTDFAGFIPSIDLYDPTYTFDVEPDVSFVVFDVSSREEFNNWGVFLQDRISVTDNLKLIGGLRYSEIRQEHRFTVTGFPAEITKRTDSAWTSTLGILFNPAPDVALFASRATSFLAVSGTTFGGKPFDPESGTQYEVGVKADLGSAVTGTVALFHVSRSNVAVSDRDNPGFLVAIGKQRTQGVEVSINARPLEGWSLYAGYAYTDSKVVRDTEERTGNPLHNVPKHTLALHSNYEFQNGALDGLSLGGSLNYVGRRAGDIHDSFKLPGYVRLDARLGYELNDRLQLHVNVDNVTNKNYFSHALSVFEVFRAAPRVWKAGITAKY